MNTVLQPKQGKILQLHKHSIRKETKKVCVDDGFTAIPNELLFAMGQFGFTQRQFNLLLAVIQKTLSWHKEMDWISNSQLCELANLPDEQKASKTKQELVRMNVLVQKGNKIGLNLVVSEWKKEDCTKQEKVARNVQKNLHKSCNDDCTKRATTKETITKEKINNPLPPNGESAIAERGSAGLEEKSRVVAEAKPKAEPIDYEGVMAIWNEVFAESPVSKLTVMNDTRKRKIHRLAKELRSQFGNYSAKAFGDYFRDFLSQAEAKPNSWYLGGNDRKWVAGFDYLMRPEIFAKTVENAL